MPTRSSMNLPTPKSWEEFEDITLDALRIKWDSPNLKKNGRKGQAQNGVDIWGEDNLFCQVGVQCKKYDLKLTLKTIEEEIKNAESFDPPIEAFYIATTLPTDAKIQKQIRLISKKRKEKNQFPVDIFFWNDIVQDLVINDKIFKKHYPDLNISSQSDNEQKRLFSLLDLSFHGLNLKYYCSVLFGEFGYLAQEDPRKIEVICSIIKSSCITTCSSDLQNDIIHSVDDFLSYLIPYVTGRTTKGFVWKLSDDKADRIAGLINSIEHSLKGDELLVFKIGAIIGRWNKYEFDKEIDTPISDEFLDRLREYITKLNSGSFPDDIEKLFEAYKSDHTIVSCATIADDVYFTLRMILIEKELLD